MSSANHFSGGPAVARLPASPAGFVGREAERRRIAGLWDRSRVVVIQGVGGIGKTALLRRLVEELGAGCPAWGYDCGSTTHLLSGFEAAMGLRLFAGSDVERANYIATVIERNDGLLCVDDVHVLSAEQQASLWGIAAMLRRGRVLATTRRPARLATLETSATVVQLGPLSATETQTLVGELLGRLGRAGDVQGLARAARGNPLWCRLLAGGAPDVAQGLAPLLEGLPPNARSVLERLSIFREPVPRDWSGADSWLLGELEERFLVDLAPGARVTAHDVVREAVLARVGAQERTAHHRACADNYGKAGLHEGHLHHLEAAGDHGALLEALHDGAAAWLWEHGRAEDYFRLLDAVERAGHSPTPRLRLRRALFLASLGRIEEARSLLSTVDAIAQQDAPLHGFVDLVVRREEGAPWIDLEPRFERLFALQLQAGDPSGYGLLVRFYLRVCVIRGQVGRILEVGRQSLRPGAVDPLSRAYLLVKLGDTLSEWSRTDDAVSLLREAEAAAAPLGILDHVLFLKRAWVDHCLRAGDLPAARQHLAEWETVMAAALPALVARERRQADVLAAEGRLGSALAAYEHCLRRAGGLPPSLREPILACLGAAAAEAGEVSRAAWAAERLFEMPRSQRHRFHEVDAMAIVAALALHAGRHARASRIARIVIEAARRSSLRGRAVLGLLLRGLAEDGLDRGARSVEVLGIALREARTLGLRPLEARIELARARVGLRAARMPAARASAEEASRLARSIGNRFLDARAAMLLAWCDVVEGNDRSAAGHAGRARATRAHCGAPVLDAEVALLGLVLRARRGSRPARKAAEERLQAGDIAAPLSPDDLWRLVGTGGRVVVTRTGRFPAVPRPAKTAGSDLCMYAADGRVMIDGTRAIDLARRPLLGRLLRTLLEQPSMRHDKARLFSHVWRLPYRPHRREATLYKAVERLGSLLDPMRPRRFLAWDEEGRLGLRAARPCLVLEEDETPLQPDVALNERQKWLLGELSRRLTLSNREYRAALGTSRATAYRDLEELVGRHLIERVGGGRGVSYRLRGR